jgi:formylglycine-generating enzyme required for sulfatase activity
MSFDAKEADYPALMTEREAADYATFAGKRLGKDCLWQPPPPAVGTTEKTAGYGYLIILGPGMQVGASSVRNPLPPPPPGMVYVPEGPFIMGSNVGDPDEAPQHPAAAGPFFVDKYEVSNAEYKAVIPDFTFEPGRENLPAVVTWEQAAAYAEKAGKRLPTEAEWEKAARGVDGRTFPWGESYDPTFVNWDEKVPRGGSPARPESPYGCIDMAGGVWEWTADWYKPYPENTTPCEQYGELYKVIRGGASFNDVAMTRTTHRYYLPPNTTGHIAVGFRCVKDLN